MRLRHDAKPRYHDIKGTIGKGNFLAVAFLESDVQVLSCRPLPPIFQERWNIANTCHLTKAACGGNGRDPTASRDVQRARSGMQISGLARLLTASHQRCAIDRTVASSPD